ncbi:MAG TPA: hypothetical protein VM077_01995 [Candidatus Limnocylindrales bacterium]|nr:hypothetical protein [Candidatus Limnocylindrales bacterium]
MTIPYITNKQQEIINITSRFRFLNRLQIQKLLNHKDYKTINMWLKDLVTKEYLIRIYDKTTFGQNTKLAIYYIGINGIRFLKILDDYSPELVRRLYRDKDRSENFINQCLLLADACLTLRDQSKNGISYSFTLESNYINPDSEFNFLQELHPNLIFTKQKNKSIKHYLVEALEPTLPRYSIRKRMRDYIDFYYCNEWENNMDNIAFPIILVICSTKAIMIATKRYTKKLLVDNQQPEDLYIRFATINEVKEHGITGEIWEESE